MAKFAKASAVPETEEYVISLSLVLSGSKKMSEEAIEALLSTSAVNVTIVDALSSDRILVDTVMEAKQFSTGSVGFGLNVRGVQFGK